MGTKRRSFSKEFKLEAVRLVIEVGDSIARVSRDLGIRSALLGRWKQEYEEDQGNAFPGKGQLKPGDELQQLRRENARLRMERDILKKATVIFVMSSSLAFMPRSNCVKCQVLAMRFSFQSVFVLIMVLMIVNNFLMHAVMATLKGLPFSMRRV